MPGFELIRNRTPGNPFQAFYNAMLPTKSAVITIAGIEYKKAFDEAASGDFKVYSNGKLQV